MGTSVVIACSPATPSPALVLRGGAPGAEARALRLDANGPFIQHEMASAHAGDVLIENGFVRFYVTGGGDNDGYVFYPGWIIDAGLASEPGRAEYDGVDGFYPLVNLSPIAAEAVTIERDGSDGGSARVSVSGKLVAIPDVLSVQGVEPHPVDVDVRLEYALGPLDRALRISTHVENSSGAAQALDVGDVILFGNDEAEAFTLPAGFDRAAADTTLDVVGSAHETRPLSYAVFSPSHALALLRGSSVADQIGGDGALVGYTLDAGEIAPGASLDVERFLAVGTDVASALEARSGALQLQTSRLLADVRVNEQAAQGVRVSVFQDAERRSWVTQGVSDAEGQVELALPPGHYFVQATGRTMGQWTPGSVRELAEGYTPSAVTELTLGDEPAFVTLELGPPAHLRLDVRDLDGALAPAKLTFRAEDERPALCAACGERAPRPDSGVRQLAWTASGEAELDLEPGLYTITASRGPGTELDVQSGVLLPAGQTTTLSLKLGAAVPRSEYVAIDSHVHGVFSQHGEATMSDRVVTALAEGLDVMVDTDHDVITDYSPALRALGVEAELSTVSGVEFKTNNGDHCAWPLALDPALPLGGALRWWKDSRQIDDQYRYYAARGAIVTQLAHGTNHFRNAGYDLASGEVSNPDRFSFGFNAMEVHNGGGNGGRATLVPFWMSLIEHGHRVAPVAASDSHGRIDSVGVARSYVRVGAGARDATAIARATAALRTVASTGPFIELTTSDGSGPGDTVGLSRGAPIELRISVFAPSWMPLEQVQLFAGGVPIQRWDAATTPAVQFDATRLAWFEARVALEPGADEWFTVAAEGSADLAPVYPGSRPWALTGPLFVDADGDGAFSP